MHRNIIRIRDRFIFCISTYHTKGCDRANNKQNKISLYFNLNNSYLNSFKKFGPFLYSVSDLFLRIIDIRPGMRLDV